MKAAPLFALFWLSRAAYAAYPGTILPDDFTVTSPAGRYSVQFTKADRTLRYLIKDRTTGNLDGTIFSSVPWYLHWAPDSRAIITVEHVPHGSCGRVIFLRSNHWADVEVRPPTSELANSAVIGLKISRQYVSYTFAVRYLKPNASPLRCAFCELRVSLEDGSFSKVEWTPASQDEWLASLERKPSYFPPMPGQ